MPRISTTVQSDVLPKSITEIRQWKNGTPHPQDDFIVNGLFLDLLIKELNQLHARLAKLERDSGDQHHEK